ncbi:MAG: glycosyltransferase [Eubacterium sp.]|nr:glycosyltransferase [Eubacterium sp.]
MDVLVSVVIPVYNVERYVADCLDSVIAQTLTDIEIICINDCSTDGSRSVVESYLGKDVRISLYDNEVNRGLATTRNRGLELAQGKYVYFLDSDDMIEATALQELYTAAERDSLDAAVFAARFIYEDESMRPKFGTNPAAYKGDYPDVIKGQELYKKWMKLWDWMPSQPRYFYRREFLIDNRIRYIDGMLHEDETFAFDVLMNAERIRVLKEEYFIRRFRASSIMSSVPTMRNVDGCITILSHVDGFKTDDDELKKAIEFYKYKIFSDVTRKYKAVRDSGQSVELTAEAVGDAVCENVGDDAGVRSKEDWLEKIAAAADKKYEMFACSSYYQVLVTLMIAMTKGLRVDIVLEKHGLETAEVLAERLMECLPDVVGYAYVMPDSPLVDPYIQRETAADENLSALLVHHVDRVIRQKKFFYDKINVFWDLGYFGTYLNIKGIKYRLHEDSLNSYQHIRENRPNYAYIFNEEELKAHKGVVPFGYSEFAEEVEVNEAEGIQVELGEKLVVNPRAELMKALTDEDKKHIFDVFLPKDFKAERVSLLILTDPLAVTGRLPDEETQIRLYRDIIEKYGQTSNVVSGTDSDGTEKAASGDGAAIGTGVFIKAHPRDSVDYKSVFPEATVIEKTIPMEVMNFDKNFHADKAITVSSSAIYGLEQVDEKIYLGSEILDNYRRD